MKAVEVHYAVFNHLARGEARPVDMRLAIERSFPTADVGPCSFVLHAVETAKDVKLRLSVQNRILVEGGFGVSHHPLGKLEVLWRGERIQLELATALPDDGPRRIGFWGWALNDVQEAMAEEILGMGLHCESCRARGLDVYKRLIEDCKASRAQRKD